MRVVPWLLLVVAVIAAPAPVIADAPEATNPPLTLPADPKARGSMMNAAVDHANVAKIKAMIALDPSVVNDLGPGGHSPLVSAVVDGNADIVALLLAAGADPKKANGQGILPLTAAAGGGQADLVQKLLDKGADPDAVDSSGAPAIFAAISRDDLETVKRLVTKGAKLNVKDGGGSTPIQAALRGQPAAGDIVQYLLDHGAILRTDDRALVDAALDSYGNVNSLSIVLPRLKDVNTLGSDGFSLLHKAVERRDAGSARTLLEHGIRVDVRSADGQTPLILAAGHADRDILKLLLEHGADPNARDQRGEDALDVLLRGTYVPEGAAFAERDGGRGDGTADLVGELLDHGAHGNAPDQFGLTPLLYVLLNHDRIALKLLPHKADTPLLRLLLAAATGDAAQTAALLAAHPDLSRSRLSTGTTPLHVAAAWGATASAAALLRAGADVNARDAYAQTPLALASGGTGSAAMIRFLLAHGADPNPRDWHDATPLHRAALAGDLGAVTALLAAKADVNARSRALGPPLACVAVNPGTAISAALLDAGADPNLSADGQMPPLTVAINAGNVPLVRLLIAHGADVNAHGVNSYTPLMRAVQGRSDEIAHLLLAAGADVGAGANGQTALTLATGNGDTAIADEIKSKLSPPSPAKGAP